MKLQLERQRPTKNIKASATETKYILKQFKEQNYTLLLDSCLSLFRSAAHKCFHEYLLGNPGFFRDLSALGYFGGTAGTDLYQSFGGMYQRVKTKRNAKCN